MGLGVEGVELTVGSGLNGAGLGVGARRAAGAALALLGRLSRGSLTAGATGAGATAAGATSAGALGATGALGAATVVSALFVAIFTAGSEVATSLSSLTL
jgi:hypothetical protein